MAREREVKVTVLGEDKGASAALHKVDNAAAKLGPSTTSANKALGLLSSTLGTHLGPAGGIVEKGLKGLPGMFSKASGEGLNLGNILKTGVAGGAAAAGTALLAFALKGVGDFQKVTGEVRQLKNVMGATAEEASGLRNVGVMLGIDTDTLAKGMLKLSINLVKTKGDFAGVQVETAKNADGTTNLVKTLDNVRTAYQSIQDPQQKNIFLTEAMSKAGVNLRGVMSLSNAEFERFKKSGSIITDADLKMALEYSRSQREMGLAMQSLAVNAGRIVIPVLTEVSKVVKDGTHWVEENTKKQTFWGKVMEGVGKNMTDGILRTRDKTKADEEAAKAVELHAAKGGALKAQLHELNIEISEDEERTGELTDATKKLQAAAEAYKAKVEVLATSMSAAYNAMTGKTGELTEAQRKMATEFDKAKGAADSLKAGLDMLVGVHLTAAQASIAWEEKIDSISGALGANKRSLDITTEAGRANQTAIIGMIQTGLQHIDALGREGASAQAVAAAYADHVAALRRVMTQAGYTDAQIDQLLGKYGLLAAAPPVAMTITANTDAAWAAIERLASFARTVNAVKLQAPGVGTSGTQRFAGGMSMGPVRGRRGEAVPVIAHGGEWVLNDEDLAKLSRGGGTWSASSSTGGGATVVVNVTAGTLVGTDGMRELTEMVRTQLLQMQMRTPLGFG